MVFKLKIFGDITFYAKKKNEIFQSINTKFVCATQLLEGAKTEVVNQERKKGGRKEIREDSNVGKL